MKDKRRIVEVVKNGWIFVKDKTLALLRWLRDHVVHIATLILAIGMSAFAFVLGVCFSVVSLVTEGYVKTDDDGNIVKLDPPTNEADEGSDE